MVSAVKLRDARLGRAEREILSIDSRDMDDIERNLFADVASSALMDLKPLNSISCSSLDEITTLPLKKVHLLIEETSSMDLIVKLGSFLQSVRR